MVPVRGRVVDLEGEGEGDVLPLLLVPASVSFVTALDTVQEMLLPVLIIGLAGTLLVMVITGRVAQAVIRRRKGAEKHD